MEELLPSHPAAWWHWEAQAPFCTRAPQASAEQLPQLPQPRSCVRMALGESNLEINAFVRSWNKHHKKLTSPMTD